MRRAAIVLAAIFGLCGAYVVAHWALIELGREVSCVRRTLTVAGSRPDSGS
jgi:hypothetical protein